MANGKKSERSVLDSVGDFFSSMANDFAIGTGLKDDPDIKNLGYSGTYQTPYEARTEATMDREKKRNAASGESTSPAQAAAAQLAQANRNLLAARGSAMSVAGAPSLPNADAVGATEQALLDANKTGRSSTISTSAAGLLAGEDSTRKKRSLMGGLIR